MSEKLNDYLPSKSRALTRRAFLRAAGSALLVEPILQAANFIEAKTKNDNFEIDVLKNSESPFTIIVAPGMQNDGHAIHNLLGPQLGEIASVISLAYPTSDASLDISTLFWQISDVMRKNNLRNPSFLGISLGGAVNSQLLPHFYEARREFGAVQTFMCDSTPLSMKHVRKDQIFLAELGRHNRYSATLHTVKAEWAKNILPDPSSHQPGIDTSLVKIHLDAIANSELWAVASQGDFLYNLQLSPGRLEGMTRSAHYILTQNDPLVDCEQACDDMQLLFGSTRVEATLAPLRPIDRHACSSEFPAGTLALFMKDFESTS